MVLLVKEEVALPVHTLTFHAKDFFSPESGLYEIPSDLERQVSGYGFRLAISTEHNANGRKNGTVLTVYVRSSNSNPYEDFFLREGDKIAFLGYHQAVKL